MHTAQTMTRSKNTHRLRRRILRLALLALTLTLVWWSRQPGTAVQGLGRSYTVRPGDSLSTVAANHHTTVAELVALNTGRYPSLSTNPGLIEPGWVLMLPGGAQPEGTLWDQTASRLAPVVRTAGEKLATLLPTPAAHPGGAAAGDRSAAPAPGGIVVGDQAAEDAILDMFNQERAQLGLGLLVMDEGLRASARQRSRDMLERGYFSHFDPETGACLAGDTAEIIAKGCTWGRLNAVAGAHSWWNSPAHYAVIATSGMHRVGIGVAYGACTVITAQLAP